MRKRIALAVVAVLLIAAALVLRKLAPLGRIGTGYAAEQTCSCLFVSGRTLESCRGDLDPLARKLVSVRVGRDEVSASAVGIAHARARYEAARGCTLVE
ncbi:MAG TPA: hypothetical protein VGL86_15030 [Polyangia bacterium]|jgi:hypothetical protein